MPVLWHLAYICADPHLGETQHIQLLECWLVLTLGHSHCLCTNTALHICQQTHDIILVLVAM